MKKIWDLTNSIDMHFLSDILLKQKTFLFGLEIFCSIGGIMIHLIQFCRRYVIFWSDFSSGSHLYMERP